MRSISLKAERETVSVVTFAYITLFAMTFLFVMPTQGEYFHWLPMNIGLFFAPWCPTVVHLSFRVEGVVLPATRQHNYVGISIVYAGQRARYFALPLSQSPQVFSPFVWCFARRRVTARASCTLIGN